MTSLKGTIYLAALALLAIVCHAAVGSDASDGDVSALATSVDANGDDTASIPDFDSDGTIGFGDFLIFAGVFGARQGDERYEAKYDLNGNGEIGFSDFVIFAQNFGKEVPSTDFTESQIYNDNVFILPVTDNLAALWTKSGNYPPLQDYTARFYEHFSDEFDFLIFFAKVRRRELELEPGAHDGAFFTHVKNDVQGIGLDTFSYNSNFGSEGKLQGVIFFSVYEPYFPVFDYSDFRQGTLLHELMHRWAAFLGEPLSDGAHWNGKSNIRGSLGGVFRSGFEEIVDLGGGRYTGAKDPIDPKQNPYPPLELYLAGFVPPEEVPDMWAAADGEWFFDDVEAGKFFDNLLRNENGDRIFSAREIKKYTIEDIIAEHGPRVPDHLQSQKDFRAAVILLVSEDYPATREILESVSDDALWFSHVGEDELEKDGWLHWNFYEATGGRGTITMGGLAQLRRRSGAKIVVPRSFGTPPPPIVDHLEFRNGREGIGRTSRHIPAEAEQP